MPPPKKRKATLVHDPLWFKDAIIYEIPIRAFADSNADGIGDIAGVVSKLDYLQDLGVTAIWLLPFYPSPLKDGGYDIADYLSVHPMYGDLADFKRLLSEAHERGIRVITELVINHTSSEHPWFQRARRSPPGSVFRDYYVWSDDPNKYADARIIFRDFEVSNWTWDPLAKAYYWHRFYSHQPDLNFENPEVSKDIIEVMDFWLDLGVDGMRLDAVPYLFEQEQTNCENLPETHAFLKQLRAHIDAKYADRMLLAEANQWPEDAAAYFGDGDECHMNFHFPLMPRMFMAVQLEDRFPIVDILRQTPTIPASCQWATFLRNHDELTLEMVTDEDRDYMYQMYADDPTARLNLGIRRRLAPLLKTREKTQLMLGLLFSLPGTPVLYYGDEIGMGDNIYLGDRDGVRTPMQWSADRNAGFSEANPQKLYLPVITDPEYRYESINVQSQQANSASLLWWVKRIIGSRRQHRALSVGELMFLSPANPKVLSFVREHEREVILIVANLSRQFQWAELDLERFEGATPVELFGKVDFPVVKKGAPYFLSLAPYSFMWFWLKPRELEAEATQESLLLRSSSWLDLLEGEPKIALEQSLSKYVATRRWFRSKSRQWLSGGISQVIPLTSSPNTQVLILFTIEFVDGAPETYLMALSFVAGAEADAIRSNRPFSIVAHLRESEDAGSELGLLCDGLDSGASLLPLLQLISSGLPSSGDYGQLRATSSVALQQALPDLPEPKLPEFEQTNTTGVFADRFLLKVYRQVAAGTNAELEIGEFMAQRDFKACPRLLGSLSLEAQRQEPRCLALVQEFIPNHGTAWQLTSLRLESYFEEASARVGVPAPETLHGSWSALAKAVPSQLVAELIGHYLSQAALLGTRTAEVHLLLASGEGPAFAPEPFSVLHQQSIYQRAHASLVRTFEALRRNLGQLPAESQVLVERVLEREKEVNDRLRRIISRRKIEAQRTRCHGDLHLGQVLFTGDDFRLIDFEGEPARPLNERRYKRSPLRDVMGMIRSFDYASESVLRSGPLRSKDSARLGPWASAWKEHVSAAFLRGYLQVARGASFIPKADAELDMLLDFYELEKVVYEVDYELNNRPDWLTLPLAGLESILARRSE